MSRIKISSENDNKVITVEYGIRMTNSYVKRKKYKENVPNELYYPNLDGVIIKRTVMNHWYDDDLKKYLYKLDSGFLIVTETELSKYNSIDW